MRADVDQPGLQCDNRDLNVLNEEILSLSSPQCIPDTEWVEIWVRRYDCYNGQTDFDPEVVENDMFLTAVIKGDLSLLIEYYSKLIKKQDWCNFIVMESFWRLIEVLQVHRRNWSKDDRRAKAVGALLKLLEEYEVARPSSHYKPSWAEGFTPQTEFGTFWQDSYSPPWLLTVHEDLQVRLSKFRELLDELRI